MSKSSVDLKKLLSQMTIDEKIGQLVELNAEFFIKSAYAEYDGEEKAVADEISEQIIHKAPPFCDRIFSPNGV
jgi:hypothetical protein